jgi:hypothetical protein
METEKVVFQEWNSRTYKVFVWLNNEDEYGVGTAELGDLSKMDNITSDGMAWWFEPKCEAGFIMNSNDLLQIVAKLNELNKS